MSHGAAGFAYALFALHQATGREEFRAAAAECIEFENSGFDESKANWPDETGNTTTWPSQWCHGAVGIGLARAAMVRSCDAPLHVLLADVERALEGAELNWPNALDTLCCGTLGTIEFLDETGRLLNRPDLCNLAYNRLNEVMYTAKIAGDYSWNSGTRRFNLGLFRGLSGVGYTMLRRIDSSLPSVLTLQ
jgi:lantibiotic modifying enzyme